MFCSGRNRDLDLLNACGINGWISALIKVFHEERFDIFSKGLIPTTGVPPQGVCLGIIEKCY